MESAFLTLVENERKYLDSVLTYTKGNIQETAKLLGLSRPGTYSRIRKHKLSLASYRQQAVNAHGG